MTRRAAWGVAVLFLLGAAPPPAVVRLNTSDPANQIEARAELDTGSIRLSETARLTLTVEGPAPLSVIVPERPLTAVGAWRVLDDALPVRELLPNGRERWSQSFRLSPLIPGEPRVPLAPLTVRAGGGIDQTIRWDEESLPTVRVTTTIENPSPDALRPPTDVEPIPPPPPPADGSSGWRFALVPALLALSAIFLILGRRRNAPTTPHDAAWALGELAAGEPGADRCAWVLRQYLAHRFAVPAGSRTTPELTAALSDRLPVELVADLRTLLDECDAARFSGTAGQVAGLADRARVLVERAETAATADPSRARRVCERMAPGG